MVSTRILMAATLTRRMVGADEGTDDGDDDADEDAEDEAEGGRGRMARQGAGAGGGRSRRRKSQNILCSPG